MTLEKRQAIRDMAELLYDFLPGSGAKHWHGHVNFGSVAERVGVGQCWTGEGNKTNKIISLFEYPEVSPTSLRSARP